MSERRTQASVTEIACSCNYLQRAADDPDVPIVFEERTGEYHYVYPEPGTDGRGMLVIYHCPFCGGAAPASKRTLLFRVVSNAEKERLAGLFDPVRTIADALRLFGTPDEDNPAGLVCREEESERTSSFVGSFRTLTYRGLSEVADVRVTERSDGTAYFFFGGKFIGDRSS